MSSASVGRSTFLDYCNSPSYCEDYRPGRDCYSCCSSFAIHQLLALTTHNDHRRYHQQVMTSYIDDIKATSDNACNYSNTTPSPVAMHDVTIRQKDEYNRLDMYRHSNDVMSRDYGSCSYMTSNGNRRTQFDDVSISVSNNDIRQRHYNYLTTIGLYNLIACVSLVAATHIFSRYS